MKIMYVLSSTTPYGGATKSFLNLMMEVTRRGGLASVVVPDENGIYDSLRKQGIAVYCLHYQASIYPRVRSVKDIFLFVPRIAKMLWVNKQATWQLVHILRQERPDIVHTNVSVVDIGLKASKALHIPHVMHFREYADKDFDMHYFPSKSIFHKRIKRKESFAICITKDIMHHHGLDSYDGAYVVYNGVVSEKETRLSIKRDDYFLFAGRLEPAKGVMDLLCAYAQYVKTSVKDVCPLWIAGGRTRYVAYCDQLENFVREQNLTEFVRFLGVRDDVNELMSRAKALIVPSVNEGFGRCMPEAMSSGCLCIAHDTGGTKEQLDNGVEYAGREIALRYNTEAELVEKLKYVARNPVEFFEQMRNDAYNVVTNMYSREQHGRQMLLIYNNIVKRTAI